MNKIYAEESYYNEVCLLYLCDITMNYKLEKFGHRKYMAGFSEHSGL